MFGRPVHCTIVPETTSWIACNYESSQSPNSIASAFYFAIQAFLQEIESPYQFLISVTKLFISIEGLDFTEFTIMEAISEESKLM